MTATSATAWISVTGATFEMGLSPSKMEEVRRALPQSEVAFPLSREAPGHTVAVKQFQLGRAPVTNREFLAFVKAGGYGELRWWTALAREETLDLTSAMKTFVDQSNVAAPLTWVNGHPPPGKEDHPVSGVSWFEAKAYCSFSKTRLPQEDEWELAARGTDGRIYPWGNAFDPLCCPRNDTVPVGEFEQGKSPYGLVHMVGNVAQWVADKYRPYPGAKDEAREAIDRVVRGDFFRGTVASLRATVRSPRDPLDRFAGLGFRCALSPGA